MSNVSESAESSHAPRHPYDAFLAAREGVMKVKWVASERLGRDIGMEAALLEWAGAGKEKEKMHRREP